MVKTFNADQEQSRPMNGQNQQHTVTSKEEQRADEKGKENLQSTHSHKMASLRKSGSEATNETKKASEKDTKEDTATIKQKSEPDLTKEKRKSKGARKSIFGSFFKKRHDSTTEDKGSKRKRKEKRSESVVLHQGIDQEFAKDHRTRSASTIDNPMVTSANLQAELAARQKRKTKEEEAKITPEEKAKRAEEKRVFLLKQTIAELISSEETYINFLTKVKDLIIVPLKSKEDVISAAVQRKIFSVFDVILNYNGTFLKELLKARETNPDCPNVAKPFKLVGNFLKVYNLYVENYDAATQVTEEQLKSNQKFRKFIDGVNTEHKKELGYPLSYYLIMPVQRIPRYVLFLKNLLEYTENDSKMHEELVDSFKLLSQVAEQINKRQRLKYQTNRVTEIQAALKGDFIDPVNPQSRNLINPRRYLVLEGKLLIKQKNIYAFLFNDMLMFTTTKDGGSSDPRYKLIESYDLLKTQVETTDETQSELSFTITVTKGSGTETFAVLCDSLSSRSDWVSMLSAEIKKRTSEHEEQVIREYMVEDSKTPKTDEHDKEQDSIDAHGTEHEHKEENGESEESHSQVQKESDKEEDSNNQDNEEQTIEKQDEDDKGEGENVDDEDEANEEKESEEIQHDTEDEEETKAQTHQEDSPNKTSHKHHKHHRKDTKESETMTEQEDNKNDMLEEVPEQTQSEEDKETITETEEDNSDKTNDE